MQFQEYYDVILTQYSDVKGMARRGLLEKGYAVRKTIKVPSQNLPMGFYEGGSGKFGHKSCFMPSKNDKCKRHNHKTYQYAKSIVVITFKHPYSCFCKTVDL